MLTGAEKRIAATARFLALPNGGLPWGTEADGL